MGEQGTGELQGGHRTLCLRTPDGLECNVEEDGGTLDLIPDPAM